MNLDQQFVNHCKKFFNEQLIDLIAEEIFSNSKTLNNKKDVVELLEGIVAKGSPKKRSPGKEQQKWLELSEFVKIYKDTPICAYAPIRGQNIKNKFCAVKMTEEDLQKVNGDRLELRCGLCTVGKRKTGCGRKLVEKLSGQQIQTTTIGGVNVPESNGVKDLMGFVSGTSVLDLNQAKTELVVKNYKGLKTEKTQSFTDFASDYEKTNFNWVIRCEDSHRTVIGKMPEDIKGEFVFPENYEEKLVELTGEEKDYCTTTYNLEYSFINTPLIDEIANSDDDEEENAEDALAALRVVN